MHIITIIIITTNIIFIYYYYWWWWWWWWWWYYFITKERNKAIGLWSNDNPESTRWKIFKRQLWFFGWLRGSSYFTWKYRTKSKKIIFPLHNHYKMLYYIYYFFSPSPLFLLFFFNFLREQRLTFTIKMWKILQTEQTKISDREQYLVYLLNNL